MIPLVSLYVLQISETWVSFKKMMNSQIDKFQGGKKKKI